MGLHRKVVCRIHGIVYSNCRCASPNKVTEPVDCHCTEEQMKMSNPGQLANCPTCGSRDKNLKQGYGPCFDEWHNTFTAAAQAPPGIDLTLEVETPQPTAMSFYAVFVKVNGIWRYEGLFFGPESSPARQRIKRLVEEENGDGTYFEAVLPS